MNTISKSIPEAIALLNQEEVIAIPTETVYGLAGNIFSPKAIASIFSIKKRPTFNPLIVHLKSVESLPQVAREIPIKAAQLAAAFWPGPLTMVLKKQSNVPDLVTAGKDTVAVRVPNHELTLALLEQLDFPLAAPSANPFGAISPTQASHVAQYFQEEVPLILDGGSCQKGIESTIIGFENDEPVLYRLGSLAIEDIEAVVGSVAVHNYNEKAPPAPGMLARHYAPATTTQLTNTMSLDLDQNLKLRVGVLSFSTTYQRDCIVAQEVLSKSGSLAEATSSLYAALHRLDSQELDLILVERFPDIGLGKTINDRLNRAAKK